MIWDDEKEGTYAEQRAEERHEEIQAELRDLRALLEELLARTEVDDEDEDSEDE